MKLNDINIINELDDSQILGNYGSAAIAQAGKRLNPFSKSGEDQLSVRDRMAKQIFLSDLIGRAASDLQSGIESELVNPDPNARANLKPPQVKTDNPTVVKPVSGGGSSASSSSGVKSPEDIRKEKQAGATTVAQQQMKANPVKPKVAPKTPDQIRKEKQAAATQTAQGQMAPFSPVKPQSPAPQSPAPQGTVLDTSTLKKAAPQQPATTVAKNAQPTATAYADQNLPNFLQSKIKGSKVAANPDADKPGFQKVIRKGTPNVIGERFKRLNRILEGIIGFNEEENQQNKFTYTISTYIQKMFAQYMRGVNITDPAVQNKIVQVANEVQQTYSKDKGRQALIKLANLGYALSHSHQDGEKQGSDVTQGQGSSASASTGDSILAGLKQGLTGANTKEIDTAKEPEKAKTIYKQIKDLLPKLDKKGRQRVLAYLDKQLGTTTAVEPATQTQEPSAMGDMAKQLNVVPPTSTGGKLTNTPSGISHKASATNPNQEPKAMSRMGKAVQRKQARKEKIATAPYVPA